MASITAEDISDTDVLCGRGSHINNHPGNVTYREMCQTYMNEYGIAKKVHKPLVSKRIVQLIKEQGGRFLQRVNKAGLWEEIEDKKAAEKTGQALRSSLYSAQALETEVQNRKARTEKAKRMFVDDQRFMLSQHQQQQLQQEPGLIFDMSNDNPMPGSPGTNNPSLFSCLYNSAPEMMQPVDLGVATAKKPWLPKLPPQNVNQQFLFDMPVSDFYTRQQLQFMQVLQAGGQQPLTPWGPDNEAEEVSLYS